MDSRARRQTGIERRDFLKGCAAVGIGALAGAASHGFLYERLHVEVTRATLSASGWADGLAGLRIGFLTDLHRSETVSREISARAGRPADAGAPRPDRPRWRLRHARRPEVRRRRRRGPVGALGPRGSLRGARQSRRRPRHGGGPERRRHHRASRRPDADSGPRRAARPGGHPLLDPPRRGHREAAARRLAQSSPSWPTRRGA